MSSVLRPQEAGAARARARRGRGRAVLELLLGAEQQVEQLRRADPRSAPARARRRSRAATACARVPPRRRLRSLRGGSRSVFAASRSAPRRLAQLLLELAILEQRRGRGLAVAHAPVRAARRAIRREQAPAQLLVFDQTFYVPVAPRGARRLTGPAESTATTATTVFRRHFAPPPLKESLYSSALQYTLPRRERTRAPQT